LNKKTIILFFPLLDPGNTHSNYPWALLYLERMLRDLDMESILIDERLDKDYSGIIEKVGSSLLFAGVSAMLGHQVVGGIRFCETLKKYSKAPVIWGGWFPTVFPEMLLNDGYADYVCIGQGEIPFRQFAERMLKEDAVSEIPGIAYNRNGNIVIHPNQKLSDPENFPEPDLSLIDFNALIDINGKIPAGCRGADYLATTGCPNNCSFCNLALVYGSQWFPQKVEKIIRDLKYIKEKTQVNHITFSDDNLFAGKKFVLELCTAMITEQLQLTWEANAHVGSFLKQYSDKDIDLLYASGCRRIKIGAESGNQEVLDLINKKIKVQDNLSIVRRLKKHGISIRFFTMVCFPLDPDKDFRQTLCLIGKAKLIDRNLDANINFYKPIPKTPLFELCVDRGFAYPQTISGLLDFFSKPFHAPWYRKDYSRQLDHFLSFYFLFADPFYFQKFSRAARPYVFLINILIYPAIWVRFNFNFLKFPFEAILFKKVFVKKTPGTFSDSVAPYQIRN
jgi:anaerobic magnesium-protoporphyrin IX monomethyl ester cyclase